MLLEPVAGTADGGDGGRAERLVDLAANVSEVDVDDAAAQVGLAVPHFVEDRVARDDLLSGDPNKSSVCGRITLGRTLRD